MVQKMSRDHASTEKDIEQQSTKKDIEQQSTEKDIEQQSTAAPVVKPASYHMPLKRLILLPLFAGALIVYNIAIPSLQMSNSARFSVHTQA